MQLPIEMITNYIRRRDEDFGKLEEALKNADVSIFKKIAHQIKGNASSFGFNELADLAQRMDEIDSSSLSTKGPELLNDFKAWLSEKKKTISS